MSNIQRVFRVFDMGFDGKDRFVYNQKVWTAIKPQVKAIGHFGGKWYPIAEIDVDRYEKDCYEGDNGHCVWLASGEGYISFAEFPQIELVANPDDELAYIIGSPDQMTFRQYVLHVYYHLNETPEFWQVL